VKKTFTFIILVCFLITLFACSITPNYPESGIYYCQELGIAIDYGSRDREGRLYLENGEFVPIENYLGYGGEFIIVHNNEEKNVTLWIYDGYFKERDDETFSVFMYSKLDPSDPYSGNDIDMGEEEFVFKRIDSYEAIIK